MRNIILIIVTIAIGHYTTPAQELYVNDCIFSMEDGVSISMNGVSLTNEGIFESDEYSNLFINSLGFDIFLEGQSSLALGRLVINANCILGTNIHLQKNIYMRSGKLNLNDSFLYLGGDILNENDNSHIFTSGLGEIVKTINTEQGVEINPGNMGFSFVPETSDFNMEIRRGHKPYFMNNKTSTNIYYKFEETIKIRHSKFQLHKHEIEKAQVNTMKLYAHNNNIWSAAQTINFDQNTGKLHSADIPEGDIFTLFNHSDEDDIFVPEAFTPNNDGNNDFYIIEGIEKYPNNRLSIFNEDGNILFEISPYQNNWGGTSNYQLNNSSDNILKNGTYFYLLVLDIAKPNKIKKGYLEIKR